MVRRIKLEPEKNYLFPSRFEMAYERRSNIYRTIPIFIIIYRFVENVYDDKSTCEKKINIAFN